MNTTATSARPPVLTLARDLMFVGRIVAEARAADVPLTVVREPAKLGHAPGRLLVVDLNLPGALEAAADWKGAYPGEPVVGFVAHTDAQTIEAARAAGLDLVLARSAFVVQLPALLLKLSGE
jgi:DNA-binding NarL/FixJ family response regulator